MLDALIEYVCVRGDHVAGEASTGREVTIHSRSWAFCAGGAEGAHDWRRLPPR